MWSKFKQRIGRLLYEARAVQRDTKQGKYKKQKQNCSFNACQFAKNRSKNTCLSPPPICHVIIEHCFCKKPILQLLIANNAAVSLHVYIPFSFHSFHLYALLLKHKMYV